MTARRASLLLLVFLGVALATGGAAHADGDFPGLPGFQTNPWDFDPGDDGVSEGPLSGGGSGAGDPWPRRVQAVPVWLADTEVQVDSVAHPLGVVAFAWTAWDGTDGEIGVPLRR